MAIDNNLNDTLEKLINYGREAPLKLEVPEPVRMKPLLAELIDKHPGLKHELKATDVSVDLTLLLIHVGKRFDRKTAKKLGLSKKQFKQVDTGDNLTIKTVHAIAYKLGYTFDLIFRKVDESRAFKQPWEESEE